ncbi:hypothetical protein DL239_10260 [Sedimentitalea sp. CY04]|uniref:DUF2497 domain-containing protein n=1 Tax=Parasedimentitalea denitrificans TaxID=2211118 RepID=A0ABX0W6Y5_9RHOB|nr:hypothetical protein [Sedimentitalea sp. CY04]NIZ61357.1 hypothetical protein [Sedimentitalea sp. CY04]
MSEPVTHSEIEDVLSSIRRLVSEDGRESPLPIKPAPKTKSVPRLVLTPSLRVTNDLVTSSDRSESTENTLSAELSAGEMSAAVMIDEDRVGELSQAGRPEAQPSVSLKNEQPDEALEVKQSVALVLEQPVTALPSVEPVVFGNDTIVHQVAEQAGEEPKAEPEQAAETAAARSETETLAETQAEALGDAPWQKPGATLFAAAGVTGSTSDCEAEADVSADTKSSASFAEKIAALEAAIGQADEQWEPDGESNEANAGTSFETLAWEDLEEELDEVAPFATAETEEPVDVNPQVDVTPEVTPASDQPTFDRAEADVLDSTHLAEQAVADEVLGGIADDETVMDEETLRELVTDIVREELQGALGERITRNVRKLVRREIHRALAVQGLG